MHTLKITGAGAHEYDSHICSISVQSRTHTLTSWRVRCTGHQRDAKRRCRKPSDGKTDVLEILHGNL